MEWTSSTAVAVAALFLGILFLLLQKRGRRRLPPGPPAWPVLGHLHLLMSSEKQPHQVVRDLAKQYGPVMLLKLGASKRVFISSPEIAKECFKTLDHVIVNRPCFASMRYLAYGSKHIPFAQGDYWRYARKMLVTELLSNQRMQQFEAVRAMEVDSSCRQIVEACKRNEEVDLQKSIAEVSYNIISTMVVSKRFFGNPTEEDAEELKGALKMFIHLAAKQMMEDTVPALFWIDKLSGLRTRMRDVQQRLERIFAKLIQERRRNPKRPEELQDFMDVLLTVPREDGKEKLDEFSMKAVLVDAFAAGTDTSSTTIEWAMCELLANPEVMKKAQEEIDSVVGKERNVRESDTAKLPYLEAVVKETFRLHMVAPWLIPHVTSVDCKVGGYDIPAETMLVFQVWGMGHDPALWENPAQFSPERFIGSDIEIHGQHTVLMPFGAGRRICPGLNFAKNVVHIMLARLIHGFDWSLPQGMQPGDVDMTETFGLTLVKRHPLKAVPAPRLPHHLYHGSGWLG